MASYQTTVTLAAPASGNVLLPNGSTVVTISLDVTAQAAVAAALAAQMANYVGQNAAIAGWATGSAFVLSGAQTYDATYGTLTSAIITWPDGATGVFTSTGIDTASSNPGGLTGFAATHVLSGTTKTATVVIPRNGSGQVSGAMTVTVA